MSIKIFGKGLGVFEHPFDVVDRERISVDETKKILVNDTNRAQLGNLGTIQQIREVLLPAALPVFDTLYSTLPIPRGDIRQNFDMIPIPRPLQKFKITPQVYSAESSPAPFETLFHDFEIEAFPFYNFWTPDELTNDRDERGNRKIEDLPRFIKVTWNSAPNLPDPEERVIPKPMDVRPIFPILFSHENIRPLVFTLKGISFTPEHLQPSGFSLIKGVIGNGYLAPGVLETVVEMPLHNTGIESHRTFANTDPIHHFDEDMFLTHPDMEGISVHELKAQINQLTNGIANMSTPTPPGVSTNLAGRKANLVDGKYMMSKAIEPGGFMQLTSIHPSSPSISLKSKTAQADRKGPVDNVIELAKTISQPLSVSNMKSSAQVKVKFSDPSIGGLIDPSKINLMAQPHHVEMMSAIAPQLPQLEMLSRTNFKNLPRQINPPSLPSPKMKPLEYIGYIIEKYKRQTSGAFIKVEEIDVPIRDADFYIDTKVLYGEVYRYRIKTVVRWTRTKDHDIAGPDPTIETKFGSQTAAVSTHKSSYFTSEWGHEWAYGSCIDDQPPLPPDELTVRPESHKKRIVVTFRLPDNPQRDILKMRLYRKVQDENGRDISDWMQVQESNATNRGIDFAPSNVIYFDTSVDFSQKSHMKYIYAAMCISRHGEDSTLSEQLAARLNEDYFSRGEFPVEFHSCPGVRLDYFGAFSTSPHKITKTEVVVPPPPTRVGKIPGVAALIFSGRNTMGNTHMDEGSYTIRVQSLDTGEVRDIPLTTKFRQIQKRQEVSKSDYYVRSHTVSGKNSDDFEDLSTQRLKEQLTKYQDGPVRHDRNEELEVLPFDRSSRGERW